MKRQWLELQSSIGFRRTPYDCQWRAFGSAKTRNSQYDAFTKEIPADRREEHEQSCELLPLVRKPLTQLEKAERQSVHILDSSLSMGRSKKGRLCTTYIGASSLFYP